MRPNNTAPPTPWFATSRFARPAMPPAGAEPLLAQHAAVEPPHQLGRGTVVNLPQTGNHALGSRIHEAARQTNQTLATDFLAETGLTRAEYDQISGQFQVVNLMQPEETVLRFALTVHQREHDTRQLRMSAVQQTMRGQVQNAVLTEFRADQGRAAGIEVQGYSTLRLGSQGTDRGRLTACAR